LTELIVCLFALALGPLLYQLSNARFQSYAFLDGFVLVAVGGLVLLEILPRTVISIGVPAVAVAVLGFLLPHFVEHRLGSLPVSPRTILSGLIILGLIVHQLLDGAALQVPDPEGHLHTLSTLGIAVILHQVPKGFLLWELAKKARGSLAAVVVIAGLLAATVAGYLVGKPVLNLLAHHSLDYFQAFVGGGLLHVVVHHVSLGVEGEPRSVRAFWSGAGALAAVASFAFLPEVHILEEGPRFLEPVSQGTLDFRTTFLHLALESAPPILLGFLTAGLIQALIPAGPLLWFRGRNRFSEALRGIVLGIPLPVCSCGVTPIYHTLIHRGVPAAAAIAFLIATPEIGVDSFFLSLSLLGWKVTVIRLAMAFTVAFFASSILAGLYRKVLPAEGLPPEEDIEERLLSRDGTLKKFGRALHYAFGELVDDIGVWLVAGLALAALAEPYLNPSWFLGLPQGLDVVFMALVGLPVYVCASGATPLAAVLLSKGISTGAVLAFLITGPTTNVTTLGILSRLHGWRRAMALPVTLFVLCVAIGVGINAVAPHLQERTVQEITSEPHGFLEATSAIFLSLLLALSILRLGPRRFLGKIGGGGELACHSCSHDGGDGTHCEHPKGGHEGKAR